MGIFFFIVSACVLALIGMYFVYTERHRKFFKEEFNKVSVLFFSVGEKIDYYPEYRDRYLYINDRLSEIQREKPKEGLTRLNAVRENLKHLLLDIEAKEILK